MIDIIALFAALSSGRMRFSFLRVFETKYNSDISNLAFLGAGGMPEELGGTFFISDRFV